MIISVAPMLRVTNHYFRYLIRLMSKRVLLYTEMITTPALLRGDAEKLLYFSKEEHPISVQLAGNDSKDLSLCAKIVEDYGYDEINLNLGCPSSRMQSAQFGACMMTSPERIAACIDRMVSSVNIPVTIKMRLGLDKTVDMAFLHSLIDQAAQAGCRTFIIHARCAVLKSNWSPKANRSKLPLHYESVYALQKAFPKLTIVLNGGVTDFDQAAMHLKHVKGVMIGRATYKNPYQFIFCDSTFYRQAPCMLSRDEIAATYLEYIKHKNHQHIPTILKLKPLMNLYHGQPNATQWRKFIIKQVSS
jgi:tRNA-dihydrouridine synthase A